MTSRLAKSTPKSESDRPQVQTAIRLPEELIARFDALAVKMSAPGARMTRSEVIRLAAFEGISRIEAKHKGKRR